MRPEFPLLRPSINQRDNKDLGSVRVLLGIGQNLVLQKTVYLPTQQKKFHCRRQHPIVYQYVELANNVAKCLSQIHIVRALLFLKGYPCSSIKNLRRSCQCLLKFACLPAFGADDKADLALVAKIREEGLNRSKVMDTLSTLTDEIICG